MFSRFRRIRDEFGKAAMVRLLIQFIGLLAMAVFGLVAFSSVWAGIIAVCGLVVGFLLRGVIVHGIEYYDRAVSIGLLVYGVVLVFGGRFGLGYEGMLLVITATTVVVFNLKFWSLSDPTVVNRDRWGLR